MNGYFIGNQIEITEVPKQSHQWFLQLRTFRWITRLLVNRWFYWFFKTIINEFTNDFFFSSKFNFFTFYMYYFCYYIFCLFRFYQFFFYKFFLIYILLWSKESIVCKYIINNYNIIQYNFSFFIFACDKTIWC